MQGATRSKAAHLQVELATDLTAGTRGKAGGHAACAKKIAACAGVAAGESIFRLPHDRKGQELRRRARTAIGLSVSRNTFSSKFIS